MTTPIYDEIAWDHGPVPLPDVAATVERLVILGASA